MTHREQYLRDAPVALFIGLMTFTLVFPGSPVREPGLLLPILDTVMGTGQQFFAAAMAAWAYMMQGSAAFLFFGCGNVAFGFGCLLSGWGFFLHDVNGMITMLNLGSLLGGLCHASGAAVMCLNGPLATGRHAPGWKLCVLAASYVAILVPLVAVMPLVVGHRFPAFFASGTGSSMLRQCVLAGATCAYALSAALMTQMHGKTGEPLFQWYAGGLALMALGLGAFIGHKRVGNLLGWVGKAAQYASGLYVVVTACVGLKRSGQANAPLPSYLKELLDRRVEREVGFRTRALVGLNAELQREVARRERVQERLRQSEESMRMILDHSVQCLGIIQGGRVVYCNDALCRVSNYPKEEVTRMDLEGLLETVHPLDRPAAAEGLRQLQDGAERLPVAELRLVTKDGDVRWTELVAARTLFRNEPALQISYVDRTAWHAAQESYRSLIDRAPYGMAILGADHVLYANRAFEILSGYSHEELLRLSFEEAAAMIHGDDRAAVFAQVSETTASREATAVRTLRFIRKDGATRCVETQADCVEHLGMPAVRFSCKDVTVERTAEEQLRATHLKIRNLAAHLLHAREEERKKVAREIHDELGQGLAALKMDLHWLVKRVASQSADLDARLQEMLDIAESTIGVVQRIASELRPRMLDDLGIAPALWQLGADFSRRTGIACDVSVDVPAGLVGGNAATLLYRLSQEALTNVGLHSRAQRARLLLHLDDGALVLRVDDDGGGIPPERVDAPDSYGLIGMRERAEELGGTFAIGTGPSAGTVVTVRVPLPGKGGLT